MLADKPGYCLEPAGKDLSMGYSEYWRRNKSSLEIREMAYALRALRKVGEYITTNFKPVEWRGMSDSNEGKIWVDTAPFLGEYPIPPGKMDVLVGLAAHEAFHCKEWSDTVWLAVKEETSNLAEAHKTFLRRMVDVGEDIYVNHAARDTVWQNYISKIWSWRRPGETRDLSLPPVPQCLFRIWGGLSLENKEPGPFHEDYLEPLIILQSFTEDIINSRKLPSLTERSNYRSKIYLELWSYLKKYIEEWEAQTPLHLEGVDILDEKGRKELGDDPDKPAEETEEDYDIPAEQEEKYSEVQKTIPRDVASYIKAALSDETARDVTPFVEVIAGEKTSELLKTLFWNSTYPCRTNPDPGLVNRLKRIFDIQISKDFRPNRGLLYGKLDGRRLYRYSFNRRVFKKKEIVFDNSWNITILVDASLSMKGKYGREWRLTEYTFASLYEAIKSSNNRLDVLCYFERADHCEVVRLLHHKKLYTVVPNGRTPTGQAIIAAALKTPKDKRRLLIHITDGEPNCGVSVDYAIKYCRKEKIDLVTLGCGYNEQVKEQFKNQYGKNLFLIDSVEQLPGGMETLLRRKLLN